VRAVQFLDVKRSRHDLSVESNTDGSLNRRSSRG
jgi:hypothetical protein